MKSPSNITFCFLLFAAVAGTSVNGAVVIRSVGGDSTPGSIVGQRDLFRADLGGGTTPGANGAFGGLRREINWDGVPAGFSAPNQLAANFFNSNSPRGAVFSTSGTGFMVSSSTSDAGAGQPAAADFGNLNVGYTSTFGTFSAQRLFMMLGSNQMDVSFFLPGTATPASVAGFGAVFSDVDVATSSSLEFFDTSNASLGTFFVPAGTSGSESLSFLGVSFNAGERIGRVRITSGSAALGAGVNDSPGTGTDLVVMDDFIYSEPSTIPEPGPAALVLITLGTCLSRRQRFSW